MTDPVSRGGPAVMLLCDYSLRYLGGAQTAFLRQARSLAAQGWTVVVVAPDADVLTGTANIVPVAPVVHGTLPGLELPILGSAARLADTLTTLIDAHGVTALVVHSEFALAAAALAAGADRRLPVLHVVHTFFWRASPALSPLAPAVRWFHRGLTGIPATPRYIGSTPINNALRGMTLRVALRADAVLSPSVHQAQALREAGVADARPFSNVSEPLQPAPPPAAEPLALVWAARFAPEKRLEIALEAVRIASTAVGPGRIRLDVAGGTGRAQPDVVFHGRVPGDRVAQLISASHAVLITSLGFDNQPMIALEGFTRGRPAVVTDPVLAEEFGRAAVASGGPDAVSLAATLIQLVREPDRLRTAGAAALGYARERQPARHAQALQRLVDQLAARGQNR